MDDNFSIWTWFDQNQIIIESLLPTPSLIQILASKRNKRNLQVIWNASCDQKDLAQSILLLLVIGEALTEEPGRDTLVCLWLPDDGVGEWEGVAHHGPVQPVLRHDAPPAPGLARLSLLGSPVLKPDLEHEELLWVVSDES